tara:strand:+ start:3526 stop:4554 length:1029 start_codon:yes stop_codon:yes gene_type:complete
MAKLGHEVRLLTMSRPEQEVEGVGDIFQHYGVAENFEVQPLPFPKIPGRPWIYAYHASRAASRWKPQLIYGRYFPAMATIGLLGFPVALESHERVWDRGRIGRVLAERLYKAKGFQKLIVISDALKEMYVDAGMIDAARIVVAHDAADLAPISEFSAGSSKTRAGYIGGVYPGRGIELVLNCAERLSSMEFHFVGGTESDIAALNGGELPENVVCHGYLPPEQVPGLRASFDILLAPYQRKVAVWGGGGDTSAFMSPLKIFEYMASGRPMICSDMPVLREVLTEENSMLCDPEDLEAWVRALEKLQSDSQLSQRIGANALADFKENYTWDIRAERILESISG